MILVSPSPVDAYPPVAAQATILAREGYEVRLLTTPRAASEKIQYSHYGVVVEGFPLRAANRLVRLAGMLSLVMRLAVLAMTRPSVEIDYDPAGVVLGNWARRLTRRRAGVVIHHHHEVLFADHASRFMGPARKALSEADLVVVADTGRAELMKRALPTPKCVYTVRNAPLAAAALEAPVARDKDFIVVYFGSVGYSQGLDTAIRSMPAWPERAFLYIYGMYTAAARAELQALAVSLGVSHRVVFRGWVSAERLITTVAHHHVALTLLRPLNDNWRFSAGASNKRFQAMAAGLPQITDEGIGVRELVEGNKVGVCIDPDDHQALASIVFEYVSNPERIEAEGARGRALISGRLNYEHEFTKVLDFINDHRSVTGATC